MRDSTKSMGGGPVRLFFGALAFALCGVVVSVVAAGIDAFPVRMVQIVLAVLAVAAAGACVGAGLKLWGGGNATRA